MRKVAAYALFSPTLEPEDAEVRFHAVQAAVVQWRDGKGPLSASEHGLQLTLNKGRVADYAEVESFSDSGLLVDFHLTEPTGAARVHTQISVGLLAGQVVVYVELQAAGDAYQVGPLDLDIRCPHVVRSLVEEYDDWHVGDSLVAARPLAFERPEGAFELEQVLWHPSRNLPVAVVSDYEGEFLTNTLPADLASELVGVALVATADAQVSWGLTNKRGKEWSCYNGAVRLYWPRLGAHGNPLRHPLWTRHTLLSNATGPKEAAAKLVHRMRRDLLGLSAFSVPEPTEFGAIRLAHSQALTDAAVTTLRDNQDWDALEEMYAKANDELRDAQEAQRLRIADLEAQVANLQVQLRWQPEAAEELVPETHLPPATVQEAVATAKRRFPNELTFGSDVEDGVRGLAADAGPPEKVLMYLERLADMVTTRRRGALGQSVPSWFRDRKVAASGESDTVKNSGDEQRKRTWSDGNGRRTFDMHLKPNDGAHPDRCVRIYFDYDEIRKVALVGWVGRHP